MSVTVRLQEYNDRVRYVPSENPSDVESKAFVRQNAWKKEQRQSTPAHMGLLSLPYAHTKRDVDDFHRIGAIPEGPSKLVADLPIGTIVYVPDGRSGYLVRLVSEVKAGLIPLKLIRKERTCGHTYTEASRVCQLCSESVVCVGDHEDALGAGYIIEPFFSLYRECDLVGRVKIPETMDLRTLAGQNTAGKKNLHWRRVETE